MSEAIVVAILATVTTLTTAGILPVVVSTRRRMSRLERRDRLSWLYVRSLIDHAYRHGAVPLPEPPIGWAEEI